MRFHSYFKLFPIIILFSLLTCKVHAQEWHGGVDGGLNISSIKLTNQADYVTGDFSSRLGLHLGIFGEYGFSERWFAQIWFNYDQRAAKFKDDRTTSYGESYSADLKLRTHYFSLPLFLKYNFISSDKIDLYGQFGPMVSFLGWAKVKGTETLDGSTAEINERLYDTWTKVTTSLIFGIGMEFNHTEEGNTFVQLQYNLGLSDVQEQGFYYDSYDTDARNRTITLTIGYKGRFGN